eukprot:356057-Chlamydomonas_euryale.AAC.4
MGVGEFKQLTHYICMGPVLLDSRASPCKVFKITMLHKAIKGESLGAKAIENGSRALAADKHGEHPAKLDTVHPRTGAGRALPGRSLRLQRRDAAPLSWLNVPTYERIIAAVDGRMRDMIRCNER